MNIEKGKMLLKDKINEDMHTSLKAGEKIRTQTLRLLMAAIQTQHYATNKPIESDVDILSVIQKQVKERDESIEAYKIGNRPDLWEKEEAEKKILLGYLPQQMTKEEIEVVAQRIIEEVGKEKKNIMPKIITELKGKAPGQLINSVVTELIK